MIRKRLPEVVYREFQRMALAILKEEGLLKGRQLALDATTTAASASMSEVAAKRRILEIVALSYTLRNAPLVPEMT